METKLAPDLLTYCYFHGLVSLSLSLSGKILRLLDEPNKQCCSFMFVSGFLAADLLGPLFGDFGSGLLVTYRVELCCSSAHFITHAGHCWSRIYHWCLTGLACG
jgi:hypothetical protein